MQRSALVASVLAAALLLGGCSTDDDRNSPRHYVALGDSFTSGAGLPQTTRDGAQCGRSTLSYPHLLAEAIGAELTDVSCGGATTENGTQPQTQGLVSPQPAQLDALTRKTELVTIGLGGNDFGWFLGVMVSCTAAAAQDPAGAPCKQIGTSSATDITAVPPRIGARLEVLLTAVHRQAPDAQVVLVGYPQPVPARGTCPELPLAAGDYAFVRAQWEALDAAMREAAAAAGVTFVEVLAPSEGHDICAGDDAWVNGVDALPDVAASYHPLAAGQAAVADLVELALRQQ